MNLLFTLFLRITAKYRDFRNNNIPQKVKRSRFRQKFQLIGKVTEVWFCKKIAVQYNYALLRIRQKNSVCASFLLSKKEVWLNNETMVRTKIPTKQKRNFHSIMKPWSRQKYQLNEKDTEVWFNEQRYSNKSKNYKFL